MAFYAFSPRLVAVTRRFRDQYEAKRAASKIFGDDFVIIQYPPMLTPEQCMPQH